MSMRLKGMLMNHLHAQLEQHLFEDAVVLKNVPCEMTFQTAQGYMEFEGENHAYLPVFHLIGSIVDIRGDFPFRISSIYFDDKDKPYLTKDVLYYPNPDELAHMIQVGKFYTKSFAIPEILDKQEYSFPARVNLTIIPPPNVAAYEMATYGGDFVAETDEEKLNLPIVYLEMAGTGITRKTDKLLDYYGIDFEDGFEIYPLTAESSGYVDPPLMMYMEEPEMVTPDYADKQDMSEMYITKEEEAQMIREQRERESQKQQEEPVMSEDYQLTNSEDVLIAKADRRIAQRVSERVKQNLLERQSHEESMKQMEAEEPEHDVEDEVQDEHDDMLDFLEKTASDDFIMMDPVSRQVDTPSYDEEGFLSAEEDTSDVSENEPFIEDEVAEEVSSDTPDVEPIVDEVAQEVRQPDVPQQQAEVKMDLNPEKNIFVEQERQETKESGDGLVDNDSDRVDMEHAQGADVDDASLQAKLDEAHTRDVARDVARTVQDDIVKQDEHKASGRDKIETRVQSQTKHGSNVGRTVPSEMSDIADEYDASRLDVSGNSSEYQ